MDLVKVLVIIILILIALALVGVRVSAGATPKPQSPVAWAHNFNKYAYFHNGPSRIRDMIYSTKVTHGMRALEARMYLKKTPNKFICVNLVVSTTPLANPQHQILWAGVKKNCNDFPKVFVS